MEVKFSKNSTKTITLFILDFSIINMNNENKTENKTSEILNACVFWVSFFLFVHFLCQLIEILNE